jgi:hypothetical protein
MAYITVAELREYLSQVKAGVTQDAELSKVIDRAHQIVNDALGFEFAAWASEASAQDVLTRSSGVWLWVPHYKLESVATVQSVFARGTDSEDLDTVTDWMEEDTSRLYANGGWTRGSWYRVTAIWGYGPVPDSIVEVELEAAVNIWRGRDAAMWQSEVGVAGQGAVSFNRALSWSQRDIIKAVRLQYLGVVHA